MSAQNSENIKSSPSNLPEIDYEAFRDTIGTVDQEGKRRWIYPKKPRGRYHTRRIGVSIVLLSLLFLGPVLKWNGQPMFLFNILERKFIIFGLTFWPQDFHLFVLAMLSFMVFVVLFTVVFGRVWCGWACPQTIFMEMVFRKIEYWIEGDRNQQVKLDQSPWNSEKIVKKGGKWLIFYAISFLIANTLMAYLIGLDEVAKIVTESPLQNWGKFTGILIFSGIFYFIFAYFREQACIAVCPYGRLQGVMLGKDSIVVAYDFLRGEPRQRVKKNQAREGGHCVDCSLCVQVCPTGIDIRNGTQMECVNCTACMDVCDDVMDKVGFERGLIRYDSYNGIASKTPFRFTARIAAYSVVLVILLSVLGFLLAGRSMVETTILRTPGMLFNKTDDGMITNLYNIEVVNKTAEAYSLELKLVSHDGRIRQVGAAALSVNPRDITKSAMFVDIPPEQLTGSKTPIKIEVWAGDKMLDEVKTNFLGPVKR
ncbi:MAG: cytochrome c oxidase accessory protein CcoG [Bacteroidia bacterium]|nr:cytochrome c oxidase accessory protein CcoG [Bacteroidia bacterium]